MQGWGLGSGWGLCLGPTGPEKALGGVGLLLSVAGGTQECLWPWRVEDQVRDPSRLPRPKWAGEMLVAFPLILEGPFPLASLLLPAHHAPRTHVGRRGPGMQGPDQKPNRLPGAQVCGETPAVLPLILRSWRAPLSTSRPLSPCFLHPTPLGPTRPEGASEGRGPGSGVQQAPWSPSG